MSIDQSPPGGKFMKANCTAAQLHQDVVQVIQQLMMIGKLRQSSSHANRKNKKKGYRGRKRYTYIKMSYWATGAGCIDNGAAIREHTGQTWSKAYNNTMLWPNVPKGKNRTPIMQGTSNSRNKTELPGMGRHRLRRSHELATPWYRTGEKRRV